MTDIRKQPLRRTAQLRDARRLLARCLPYIDDLGKGLVLLAELNTVRKLARDIRETVGEKNLKLAAERARKVADGR